MHDDVRIAADRRCEVRVQGYIQSVVVKFGLLFQCTRAEVNSQLKNVGRIIQWSFLITKEKKMYEINGIRERYKWLLEEGMDCSLEDSPASVWKWAGWGRARPRWRVLHVRGTCSTSFRSPSNSWCPLGSRAASTILPATCIIPSKAKDTIAQ